MADKTILITGGAGFIGSHLSDYFIRQGFRIVVLDNLLTGNQQNIEHLKKDPKFLFIHHNISNHFEFPDPVHYILHFASPASPADYLNYPIPTLKVGALGTHNALGLAKAKKATLLLASTSEVYGDPLIHPQKEDYWGNVNPVGPRGVYDEAKRFAEAMTMAYYRYHRVDAKIIRIFNTYGTRMRVNDGRAIPAFISQALQNVPLTVYGSGDQTRSFCYVDDLVEAILRFMDSSEIGPINIGNASEFRVLDLASEVIRLTGSTSSIIYKPLPFDDPKQRCPDLTKVKTVLNWEAKTSLEQGLIATIRYFEKRLALKKRPLTSACASNT